MRCFADQHGITCTCAHVMGRALETSLHSKDGGVSSDGCLLLSSYLQLCLLSLSDVQLAV